jgi:paraquat-inducible protein B
MRKLVVLSVFALAAATPAVAQVTQSQLEDLRAQQQAAERRYIDQSNQLQALDARLRADQAVADLAAQRAGATVPQLRYPDPTVRSATATPSTRYPSMPDAALADSNKRVQDAARNRR